MVVTAMVALRRASPAWSACRCCSGRTTPTARRSSPASASPASPSRCSAATTPSASPSAPLLWAYLDEQANAAADQGRRRQRASSRSSRASSSHRRHRLRAVRRAGKRLEQPAVARSSPPSEVPQPDTEGARHERRGTEVGTQAVADRPSAAGSASASGRGRHRRARPDLDRSGWSPAPTTSTRPAPSRAAIGRGHADRAGRPRRPVVRARGRGQHRPRGHDDPRHMGRRLLRLLLRAPGPASSARSSRRRRWRHPRARHGHLRRRPHRLRCGDQHHRRRRRQVPRRPGSSTACRAAGRPSRRRRPAAEHHHRPGCPTGSARIENRDWFLVSDVAAVLRPR